jgi:cell division protein FtsQ
MDGGGRLPRSVKRGGSARFSLAGLFTRARKGARGRRKGRPGAGAGRIVEGAVRILAFPLRLLRALRLPGKRTAQATHAHGNGLRSALTARMTQVAGLIEPRLPRWSGLAAMTLLLMASLVFGVVRGDHVGTMTAALRDARDVVANAAGFRIADVAVTGRKHLTTDDVLAIGGVTDRTSLLFLDAAGMRERLKRNPWIGEATVLKFYPGRLQVDIVERSAFALWQADGHVSLIAQDGAILDSEITRRFANLPLVVGVGAHLRAKEFLAVLDRYPHIRGAMKAAVLVGERRWNLRFANGIDVKLPEEGLDAALTRLTQIDREDHLLSRDIAVIDLRLPDRITVRLSETAAASRAEQFKDKKYKRKAGDA